MPTGCRSPPTVRSSRARDFSPMLRTCIISAQTAAPSSTAARVFGAPTPDIAALYRRGHKSASRRTPFSAAVSVRASESVCLGEPDRRAGARRFGPRVLYQFRVGGGGYTRAKNRHRLSQPPWRSPARGWSDESAAFMARASAAWRSAASAQTANSSALFSPASIIFHRPMIAPSRPSRRASRNGARIAPTRLKKSSACTMPRRLPRLSSSPWPARLAFCRPPPAIRNG